MQEAGTNRKLLIIFYKNPQLGKVKTRLAASLGEEKALAIYLWLTSYTQSITEKLPYEKVVYYSDYIDSEDNWPNSIYIKKLQSGNNLGERMHNAFASEFSNGYHAICIVGTDCLEITEPLINLAFKSLEDNDAVIGPAHDGGYYLLGMKKFHPNFFFNKQWSTSSVALDTIQDFSSLRLTYKSLPVLHDIDTLKNLPPTFII